MSDEYSPDAKRVCEYLQRVIPDIGCGDDPIGFLIASHALKRGEAVVFRRRAEEMESKLRAAEKRAGEAERERDEARSVVDRLGREAEVGLKLWQECVAKDEAAAAKLQSERDSSQASLLRVEKALAHVEQWLTAWAAPPEDKPDRDSWIRGRNRILEVARTALSPHTEKPAPNDPELHELYDVWHKGKR